jgi:hypothetical protein
MRLYTLTFAEHREGCHTVSHWLAEDDLDFLEQLKVAGLSDVEDPKPPSSDASERDWGTYHEDKKHFHDFMAHALGNNEFSAESTERRGRWEYQELSEEDLATIQRLGIVNQVANE